MPDSAIISWKKSPITPRSSSAAVNNHLSQWRLERASGGRFLADAAPKPSQERPADAPKWAS